MGNCNTCESTNVATAKVILQDGRLQEFAYPVKVSQVLEKNPTCFVTNMDDMDFDSFISAINGDEDLLPGRLYFALPMTWLKSPLRGEKMASLVVKASLALKKRSGHGGRCCGCGVKRDDVLMYYTGNRDMGSATPRVVVGGGRVGGGTAHGGRGSTVRQRRQGVRGRGGFATRLSVIIEEQGEHSR